jgi:hypothetical protein
MTELVTQSLESSILAVLAFETTEMPQSPDQIGTLRYRLGPANILKLIDAHHTGGKNQKAGVRC